MDSESLPSLLKPKNKTFTRTKISDCIVSFSAPGPQGTTDTKHSTDAKGAAGHLQTGPNAGNVLSNVPAHASTLPPQVGGANHAHTGSLPANLAGQFGRPPLMPHFSTGSISTMPSLAQTFTGAQPGHSQGSSAISAPGTPATLVSSPTGINFPHQQQYSPNGSFVPSPTGTFVASPTGSLASSPAGSPGIPGAPAPMGATGTVMYNAQTGAYGVAGMGAPQHQQPGTGMNVNVTVQPGQPMGMHMTGQAGVATHMTGMGVMGMGMNMTTGNSMNTNVGMSTQPGVPGMQNQQQFQYQQVQQVQQVPQQQQIVGFTPQQLASLTPEQRQYIFMQQQQQLQFQQHGQGHEHKHKHKDKHKGETTQKYLEFAMGFVGLPPPAPDTGKKLVGAVQSASPLLSPDPRFPSSSTDCFCASPSVLFCFSPRPPANTG